MGAAILAERSADSFAQNASAPADHTWDAGQVRHLLPAVSDTRILLKASFAKPQTEAPVLRIGHSKFRGTMNDTEGVFWQFHATGLEPGKTYSLSLAGAHGKNLCQPWNLTTFPPGPRSHRAFAFSSSPAPAVPTASPAEVQMPSVRETCRPHFETG